MARRLGLIIVGLVALVARRFLRMPHLMGLTLALCARLGRAGRRFARAIARPGKARGARGPHADTSRADGAQIRAVALPSGRGWLVRELGWEAAGYGCQLEALIAEPAMQALLASLPATGRILRPLCRMLGVATPVAVVEGPAEIEAPVEKIRRARRSVWPPKGLPILPKGAWFAPPVQNRG